MELNFVEIFIHRDGSISRIFADKYILDIKNSKFMYKEELDRIYTDDSNQDILNRNIVNFQTLINKRENREIKYKRIKSNWFKRTIPYKFCWTSIKNL